MSDNLPGFKEELEAANEAARRAHVKRSTSVPDRSEARASTALYP